MAGGIGSRFWPLSRNNKPKQFIDMLGTGRTLIQMTFDRFRAIVPDENFYIVTNEIYKEEVIKQLPGIPVNQILTEPERRNTAPCIAYASFMINAKNSMANIVVSPADHHISNLNEFLNIIKNGLSYTEKNDSLLTLGIAPTRPDTGYGYIQVNESNSNEISKVKAFTEKPNIELAKIFYDSGEFYWNSGIFFWNIKTILDAFEKHLSSVFVLFKKDELKLTQINSSETIHKIYKQCPSISIDYGIMEKSDNVYVLPCNFGWSDLGSYSSMHEQQVKDDNNNATSNAKTVLENTKNCIINVPKDKVVVVQGLEDYIIIDSGDNLLICKKENEQHIKEIMEDVKNKYGENYI